MDSKTSITLEDVPINENLYRLYTICLQYYHSLYKSNHPKIDLITEVMDKLIELQEDKDMSDREKKERFSDVHSLAYVNIQTIYDYDKEEKEKKGEVEEVKQKTEEELKEALEKKIENEKNLIV